VARKSKDVEKQSEIVDEAMPSSEVKPAETAPRPPAKSRKKGSAAKKTAAGRSAKPPRQPVRSKAVEPTNEEIQLRAYFISERRHRLGLPGDASSDWLEARRQLVAEAGLR
jgi:cell division septation protein DedD